MELRKYQQAAVEAVWDYLNFNADNPCIVIPTAGGKKSPVMGKIADTVVNEFGGRVMIMAHVKELLEQNVEACLQVNPELKNRIGIYSAGLKSRQSECDIVVAGIQSAYRDATRFGKRDIILVDEAHLIAPKAEGMYMRFLQDAYRVNPKIRVVGLTATPYRMKGGMICKPDAMLNRICYEVSVKDLIDQGFLSNLRTKATANPQDFSGLHTVAGEFSKTEVRDLMEQQDVVRQSCEEIARLTQARKSVLVFCSGVDHAKMVAATLHSVTGVEVGEVYGDTDTDIRRMTLNRFKGGSIRYLCNVGVLTTGFNAPNIDCVVLLMPTKSPGKYYQCVGRGFRLCHGKEDCLVLDYGGNIMRHGPVDAIEITTPTQGNGSPPAKTCPECLTVVHISVPSCPECGYTWPKEEKELHEGNASTAAIISGDVEDTEMVVKSVELHVHEKKGFKEGDPRTVRIEYTTAAGWREREWLCPEHKGYAREKFIKWWNDACTDPDARPPTVAEYVVQAHKIGILKDPGKIVVRQVVGNKYSEIYERDFGTEPVGFKVPQQADPWGDEPVLAQQFDDIPF